MSKKKKSINRRSPSPSSSPEMNVNLELDIKALRGKNKQLIQAVAKLQQEKALQLTQMTTLQEEFFKLNSKYVNLKNIFSTIDATTKVCFPKHLELVNTFGKIMQLCAVGATVSNLNKDPKTQAVKPHNVNGHVLQNPTITLSRFNDSDSLTPPRRSSERNSPNDSAGNDLQASPIRRSNNLNSSHINIRPSTSRISSSTEPNDIRLTTQEHNMDNGNLAEMVQGLEPVVTRAITLGRLNMSNMNEDVDDGLDTPEDDEEDTSDADYRARLVTIQEEEEEAYNSTLRSLNTTQSAFTDRVREIRIFLDPLPTDFVGQSENIEHFVNRTSSLAGEPSTSVLDPNSTLLNESLSSPESTMNFINATRESRNFSLNASPTSKNSSLFAEAGCSGTRVDEYVNKIQVVRGQYHKSVDESRKCESNGSLSDDSSVILPVRCGNFINSFNSLSAIHHSEVENTFINSTNVDLENSKVRTMKSLGLEPKNLCLTTSTPVAKSPRTSSRIKKLSISINSSKQKSPVDSKVTKRRGGSDDKKKAQVIIKRLSLDKRLSSGSPIKKIGELLNTSPITKASQIRKGRPKKSTQQKRTQDTESNMESSGSEGVKTPESTRKKIIQKKTVKGKTKGKENRHSPRPKRAVRPKLLKEPSLNKKMRRSR